MFRRQNRRRERSGRRVFNAEKGRDGGAEEIVVIAKMETSTCRGVLDARMTGYAEFMEDPIGGGRTHLL